MLAGYERRGSKADTFTVLDDLSQLDEAMPPEDGIEGKVSEVVKPLTLEECGCFGDFLAIAIDELEGTGKGLALTLLNRPRDVSIDEGICVDIVESESTRVIYREGRLPRTSPRGYVLSGEGIGLADEFGGDASAACDLTSKVCQSRFSLL